MSAAIEIAGVSKIYDGGVRAVDAVAMEIRQGEFFSLLGPSGCGKTTTLRMIAGFDTPSIGAIRVDGADITHVPAHKRDMAMVFQNYALFPHRTVAENVAFGLRMRGLEKQTIARKVKAALAMVELSGLEDRYPGQLSGGQQQRVALARAIVIEPRVLLCDEPLGALDKKLRQQMQFELKQLQKNLGLTLVFVTHDQEEALAMSDRIAVMNDGLLEQFSTPSELYHRPATAFVANFIGENNLVAARHDGATMTVLGRRVPFAADGVPDGDVTLAVRPECLRVGEAGADGALGAVVDQAVFMGSETRLVAHLDDGTRVMSRLPPEAFSEYERGDRITLSWAAHEARAFSR